MHSISHTVRTWSKRTLLLATAGLLLGLALPGNAYALDGKQKELFRNQVKYFNYYKADDCSVGGNLNPGAVVDTSQAQEENAKIIIGIAKTYNLGKEGALIGLMVGLTESHLRILANQYIPESKSYPNVQGVGNDHDSVGVFQQRATNGYWSTIDVKTNFKESVWQLMDPAYAAQAFFGSPPGSNAPNALKHGLQNVEGWQGMNPWLAAQKVQVSFDPTGNNYKKEMGAAQTLLDKLYDSAPTVGLPIPINGGQPTGTASAQQTCVGAVNGDLFATILRYAWPKYTPPNYFEMMPDYKTKIDEVKDKEYVGGGAHPGIDCGGFVTRVFRDSGVDPEYNKYQGDTSLQLKYLQDTPQKYEELKGAKKVHGVSDLQPGDIAVRDGHTYIYTGKLPGFEKNSASASISFNNTSWRTPMSSDAYDFEGYHWFRPLALSAAAQPAAVPQP